MTVNHSKFKFQLMKKFQLLNIATVLFSVLGTINIQAQQYIAQPYYGENKVRFYNKDVAAAASPYFILNISADVATAWGVAGTSGINDVVIYNNKIFISLDLGNSGGVLIYNYADVYPVRTATAPIAIKPQDATNGLSTAGITINPANGDLYIATFYNGSSDAGVYMATAASGYTSVSQFASYYDDNSVATYCANITFDISGNLWMTTWDPSDDPSKHYLICYKGGVKDNYYKITNDATKSYTATDVTGSTIMVNLLSAPEGVSSDAAGNLWIGNNNDDYLTNDAGQGTLAKISAAWITTLLASPSTGGSAGNPTYIVPAASATVDYIPGGKLGGLLFDADTLYINDQGQDQGSDYTTNGTVWKYNTTGAFITANFAASGIHTTYPGNGLMALNNAMFPLVTTGVTTINNNNVGLQIIPNPVTDNFNYIITAKDNAAYTVRLVDATGKTLYTQTTNANTQQKIDVKAIAPGIYTLEAIPTHGGNALTQKIEKQ